MYLRISSQILSFKFDANQRLPFIKVAYLISLFKSMSESVMISEIASRVLPLYNHMFNLEKGSFQNRVYCTKIIFSRTSLSFHNSKKGL